ncbi:MAG: hypothetical protein KY475_12605 [Planctomycetes bacterium]|nr:hypothetical protein [Planctomycetota bacterium]
MPGPALSFNTRKALTVQLGDAAGQEVANLLQKLSNRIEELERSKVSVTPVAPESSRIIPIDAAQRAA